MLNCFSILFQSPKYPSITIPSPSLKVLESVTSWLTTSLKENPSLFRLITESAKSVFSSLSVDCNTTFISSFGVAPRSNRGT